MNQDPLKSRLQALKSKGGQSSIQIPSRNPNQGAGFKFQEVPEPVLEDDQDVTSFDDSYEEANPNQKLTPQGLVSQIPKMIPKLRPNESQKSTKKSNPKRKPSKKAGDAFYLQQEIFESGIDDED
jgi:hypothetical protein